MTTGDWQPDLFAPPGAWLHDGAKPDAGRARIDVTMLSDDALVQALPNASLLDAPALAAEASRRRLVAAVPALAALCRRFKGFGHIAPIPEQVSSLTALARIGGRDAAEAVAVIITDDAVVGPNLIVAVTAAAALHSRLPARAALACLRHPDPTVRANGCRLAGRSAETAALLLDLLSDLHDDVSAAAACALANMGREEARPRLLRLLAKAPSAEAVEAFGRIADDDGIVVLGRLAASHPGLATAVLEALEESEAPRAATVAAGVRRRLK